MYKNVLDSSWLRVKGGCTSGTHPLACLVCHHLMNGFELVVYRCVEDAASAGKRWFQAHHKAQWVDRDVMASHDVN